MTEEDTSQNPIVTWIQGHLLESALIGLVSIIVLGVLLASILGEEDSEELAFSGSTSTSVGAGSDVSIAPGTGTDDPNRPEVPPVDCQTLLAGDEVDVALFGDDDTGLGGVITFAQGETCRYEADDESGHYVQIEPGDPSDFEEDAQLTGVSVERVEGVGDGARWFDDGDGLGVLSVGVNIEDASIIYRIHVGRRDLGSARRLETAQELALAALHRFPGTEPGPPEPLVDLCEMVSDASAEEILAGYRDAHPATRDEILVTDNFPDLVDLAEEGDATCTKLILAEIYIETQQGSLSDFEEGASMEGVAAEPVTGLGDEAAWFAGVPYQGSFTAPHERGVLAVRVGDAAFRVVLAVPDISPDEQLEILRTLAAGAIPQIPGAEAPESIWTEPDPVDLPPSDYVENLLAREEAGDWTRGEGLVATLELLAGEADESEVFTGAPPNDRSDWGVMALASEYVESGPDAVAAAEITQLLDLLVPSLEDLEEWSEPGEPDADVGPMLVSLVPLAQEEEDEEDLQEGGPWWDKYGLSRPRAEVDSGWTLAHIDLALDAMRASTDVLEPLGEMPPTTVALEEPGEEDEEIAFKQSSVSLKDGKCTISVGTALQPNPGEEQKFQQHIALRMAHCFLGHQYSFRFGWSTGTATYLGDLIYENASLEVVSSPKFGWKVSNPDYLRGSELHTNAAGRGSTNWALYEYIADEAGGAEAVLGLAAGFPRSIAPYLHDYNLELTDGVIHDVAGTHSYANPPKTRLDVFGPTERTLTPGTFGLKRLHVVVQPGKYACLNTSPVGDVRVSWSPGRPGTPGSWVSNPPDVIEGESVFVVTSLQTEASVKLEVTDVADDPDCEEDEGGRGIVNPILELCEEICDPSTYYWGPIAFN